MKKNITNFIGIDISKASFDMVLLVNGQKDIGRHQVYENSSVGVKRMLKWLVSAGIDLDDTIFCMEHTGIYSFVVAERLYHHQCLIWIEMPARIIRSMGLQRGKNDKVDAQKIALYAYKNREDFRSWVPPRKEILQIKDLLSLRERISRTMIRLTHPISEMKQVKLDKRSKYLQSFCKSTLAGLKKDICAIETELEAVIGSDQRLSEIFSLLTSIPGIGKVTAWHFIVITNEFTLFESAKQLACNVGVVPFDYQSGTSIIGKSRVSRIAHIEVKRLLHLAAISLIKKDNEFKRYYDRKVEEGKNKMLVLNAIRNKLVHRMVAVVKRGTPYETEYQYAA